MSVLHQRKLAYGSVLTDEQSSPQALLYGMVKYFGPEVLDWEAETLWQELTDEFGEKITGPLRNKYQAARTVSVSNLPWKHYHVFLPVARACFGGSLVYPELIQPEPHEICWCLKFMSTTHPLQEFDEEIKKTVAALVFDLGFAYFPPEVLFVNGYLLELGTPPALHTEVERILAGAKQPQPGTAAAYHSDQVVALRNFLTAMDKQVRNQIERLGVQ